MNAILNAGKWLYAVPFLIFGIFHFTSLEIMAGMAPFGGKAVIILTGLALIAAAVSMFIGKMDKLATMLLAVMLILFVAIIHFPSGQDGMTNALKDLALAGAALMYAKHVAKDNAVVG